MQPTLPQHDSQVEERQRQLDEARSELRYAWDRPAGVATAAEVPRRLGYPAGVLVQAAEASARLAANEAAVRLSDGPVDDTASGREWCGRLYRAVEAPPIAGVAGGESGADRAFAWQRLAGANPLMLSRVTTLPAHFPVSEAAYRSIVGGDSLAAAGAEGRLWLGDWGLLDGLPAGSGRSLCAPLALFAREKAGRALWPVAIQCGQRPGPGVPIYTPLDGVAWQMARLAVQAADANVHESYFHLGRAHFLLEAFALATERQLARRHPLFALLSPHFEGTLAINGAARDKLVVPGGDLETLLAPTLAGSLELVRRSLASFRLDEATPPRDLARRGADDAEALPDYPYREDGLLLWGAIREFVGAYVALYYADGSAIAGDTELRAWLDELRSPDGGRLSGLPASVDGAAGLVELLSFVVYTASAFHAALNYTQYDFMGHAPNMPMATHAPPPSSPGSDATAAWASALPDRQGALAQLAFAYRQSQVRDNRLGRYPLGAFTDPRVRAPLDDFQRRLGEIEEEISARNARRWLPYPYLLPSRLTASTHI